MKLLAILILCAATGAFGQSAQEASRNELNQGIQAYKTSHYAEAVKHFQEAVRLDPSNQNAQLYLATSYYIQWVPGADSAENNRNHDLAHEEFDKILRHDPKNELSLAMMASMSYNASQVGTPEQKAAALEEAKKWNERRLDVNPRDSEALYYLGVIAWARAFPPIQKARVEVGMKPGEPGPLKDAAVRSRLQSEYWKTITEGLDALEHCLQIDKENDDAMSYANLLLRKKADLEDNAADAAADEAQAEEWFKKGVEIKKAKAAGPPKSN